ncbi:MAG TPA: serine/threonine-protein kinase [Burkholderiales bacterium]|nr:serine/threonine-protein kinase [Burkholderiales bacterium]
MSDPIPAKLGKYIVRRELGRGAMGVVYEGFDPFIERTVAIKTIRPQQLAQAETAEILARFKREAQAAGRLNHPNIVQIYEYGEEGGVAFIAMEFIKGRELKDYFDAGQRFANKDLARIMGEMLGALDHAHASGVTHRDMKPANVILLESGTVKVADFGIARIETSELTQAGTVLGTPSYMSPEQFLGTPVDGRSDIFSCGVILYQLLTGERPFSGAVTTIMHKVLKEDPLPPSALNTTLPPAWDAVVKKAMAKSPAERYQRASQFAADIVAVAEGRTPAAASEGADATLVEATMLDNATVRQAALNTSQTHARPASPTGTGSASRGSDPVPTPAPTARKSNNLAILAGAAAAILAVGGGVIHLVGGKKPEAPAAVATTQAPIATAVPASAVAPAPTPVAAAPVAAPPPAASEPGILTISAVGLADPAKFNGDAAAAGVEARADAKRQLIEKALALYVSHDSLNRNYKWLQEKILPRSAEFIKTTLAEEAPQLGKDGLVSLNTRATIKVRDVQKSLNQMSDKERVEFIRNNGDPKIAVQIVISNADTSQAVPSARSQLAENAIKERIKSFGFRTWSLEGETKTGAEAKVADFHIVGEVKVKTLSAKLAASGLTITKTALTSWTVKAIDKASGEEIYTNTRMPKNTSWPSEDAALAEIGRLVGDEFSKNFFLAHFSFGAQNVNLAVSGLPGADSGKALLRELRSLRGVLDAQAAGEGAFRLELPEGSVGDLVAEHVLNPLNAKLGQTCFSLGAVSGQSVGVSFAAACGAQAVRGKLETTPPAGLLSAPAARKAFLKV